MKAYCGFDPRVGALLPFVKLWARQLRGKCVLNSYTLSIMLIYSLQRTSPPVLPCLQNPGVWPRNMDWYKGKSFQFENEVPTELTAPWDIKFVPPQSLSPSTNTESPGMAISIADLVKVICASFSLQFLCFSTFSISMLTILTMRMT